MKYFLIVFAALFFAACSPGKTGPHFQISSINPQTDISAMPNRSSYELYSWHNGQNWAYSLLPSATTIASYKDITQASTVIVGTDYMLESLTKLGRGAKVYWNLKKIKGFSLPDQKVVDGVKQAAKKDGITLEVISWPN
ncbi:MAG: hypothetical protein LBM71_06085 [Elusimicrobiota bacterium]|jgi:hypothetical protein|nr:hypothetical protein [Elusimicrobiota bacterium]